MVLHVHVPASFDEVGTVFVLTVLAYALRHANDECACSFCRSLARCSSIDRPFELLFVPERRDGPLLLLSGINA